MKDDYTTNSHYLIYTFLLKKVGRMYSPGGRPVHVPLPPVLAVGPDAVQTLRQGTRVVRRRVEEVSAGVRHRVSIRVARNCAQVRVGALATTLSMDVGRCSLALTPKSDQFQISPAAPPEL